MFLNRSSGWHAYEWFQSERQGKNLAKVNERGVTTHSRTQQIKQSDYFDGKCVKSPETCSKESDPTYLHTTVDQSGENNLDLRQFCPKTIYQSYRLLTRIRSEVRPPLPLRF